MLHTARHTGACQVTAPPKAPLRVRGRQRARVAGNLPTFVEDVPLQVFPKTGACAPAHARKPRCMLSPTRGISVLSSLMLLPHVSGFTPLVHDEHVDG